MRCFYRGVERYRSVNTEPRPLLQTSRLRTLRSADLLRLLRSRGVVVCRGLCCGALSQIAHAIVQQADVDASTMDTGRGGAFLTAGAGHLCVADSKSVNAVDGNVVLDYEIPHNGLRHRLRVADRDLSTAGREALHFNDGSLRGL